MASLRIRLAAAFGVLTACSSFAFGCASSSGGENAAATSASELRALGDDEIIGSIEYGQLEENVEYSAQPEYRAYWFDAVAGDSVVAKVSIHAGSTGTARAWLLGPDFSTLKSATGDLAMTYTVARGGRYYVAFRELHDQSTRFDVEVDHTSGSGAEQCRGGGNVLYMNGEAGDWVHPGEVRITDATRWSAAASGGSAPNRVTVSLDPTDRSQGLFWDLTFSTAQLGRPMTVATYENAQRAAFAEAGHAGLDVGGDGRGCNTIEGSFTIVDIQTSGAAVTSFTATFEQHCEGGRPALRGCVHYGQ